MSSNRPIEENTRVRVTSTPKATSTASKKVAETLDKCAGKTAVVLGRKQMGGRTTYRIQMESVTDPKTGEPFEWGAHSENITPVE